MEQTDYLLMRAPRPTLVCATTEDFFDIRGTWDTMREAKRFYGLLSAPERVDVVEATGKHGIGPLGRRTMVHWMRRWLAGVDQPVPETELKYWTEAELYCTPRGQVLLESGERSVYEFNADLANELAGSRRARWEQGPPPGIRDEIRRMIAARPSHELPPRTGRVLGSLARQGYRLERLVLEAEGQMPLACLRFVPDQPSGAVALVLDGEGKAVQAVERTAAGDEARISAVDLARQGTLVLAVDLSGLGETAPGKPSKTLSAEWKEYYLAYLMGRSLVGLRAAEVWSAARWAIGQHQPPGKKIILAALGRAAVPALHAAALEPELFQDCRFAGGLESWQSIAGTPCGQHLADTVHGALRLYDLPDLQNLIGGS
jgi:hypothetical protein